MQVTVTSRPFLTISMRARTKSDESNSISNCTFYHRALVNPMSLIPKQQIKGAASVTLLRVKYLSTNVQILFSIWNDFMYTRPQ